MGWFKKHHDKEKAKQRAEDEEKVPLERGLLYICDGWEADVFRSKKQWKDRVHRREQLAVELTQWMYNEVIPDQGMISSWDLYEDGLTTEIGESVGDEDPELADALKSSEDEEEMIQRLSRQALEFTQKITTAYRDGGDIQGTLRDEEKKATKKVNENLTQP